jgi:hypothetical protein
MTRDDIIKLAQAGRMSQEDINSLLYIVETVAAAERERNAQIADAHASVEGIAQVIAAEIRGRA